jgi:hypothetical protein
MNKILILLIIFFFAGCSKQSETSNQDNLNKEVSDAKLSEFKELYFVGIYAGLPSIYKYDYAKNTTKVFWSHKDERVLDLLISQDRKNAYFITRRRQRLKSSQPAIERGQLYRIDLVLGKTELITQLEEGIQIIPFWTDNDRFTLVINSIDKTIASYINKNTQVYNKFGKLLSDNNEIFDITKDGYPVTKLPSLNFTSPNGMFNVLGKKDSVWIKQSGAKDKIRISITNKKIMQIGWAENKKQAVFLLMDKADEDTKSKNKISSTLIIFDLQKKKIVKSFNGPGYKRFVLIGDFLIFDSGFGKDSFIALFSLSLLKNIHEIKITGGCGLKNIPGI